jgi:hypothetical protein
MSVIQFPRQKPRPGQIPGLVVKVGPISYNLSTSILELTNQIMGAETAEDLATAIRSMREKLESHAAAFAKLEEATRHWR